MKKILCALIVVMSVVNYASACSCAPIIAITEAEIQKVDLVFEGIIENVEEDVAAMRKVAYVVVTKAYHGVEVGQGIEISTAVSGAACGLSFGEGQEWFFFVKGRNGKYSDNMCSRSQVLDRPNFDKRIRF